MLPTELPRANVLGVGVHAIDLPAAVAAVAQQLERGRKGYICVTGVHGVMEAQRDAHLRRCLNTSFLTVPDGMPTVWVGHAQGFRNMRRVYGPDLMFALCDWSRAHGYTHFLYGGKRGVGERLRAVMENTFPGIAVVGTYTPPFRPMTADESQTLCSRVETLKPDLFWVGISTPQQERFMAEYLPRLNTRLMIGVGAAFDIHTGAIADAPAWIKDAGLQWLHRLAQEPGRLWKRYLLNNPLFIAKTVAQLVGLSRYQSSA